MKNYIHKDPYKISKNVLRYKIFKIYKFLCITL